jgi:hypothetical protein
MTKKKTMKFYSVWKAKEENLKLQKKSMFTIKSKSDEDKTDWIQ